MNATPAPIVMPTDTLRAMIGHVEEAREALWNASAGVRVLLDHLGDECPPDTLNQLRLIERALRDGTAEANAAFEVADAALAHREPPPAD